MYILNLVPDFRCSGQIPRSSQVRINEILLYVQTKQPNARALCNITDSTTTRRPYECTYFKIPRRVDYYGKRRRTSE